MGAILRSEVFGDRNWGKDAAGPCSVWRGQESPRQPKTWVELLSWMKSGLGVLCVERRGSFLYYQNVARGRPPQKSIHSSPCWDWTIRHRRIQPLTPSFEMPQGGRDSIWSLSAGGKSPQGE